MEIGTLKIQTDFQPDIDAIESISAVPTILAVVCKVTGMGYAAIARVTDDRWVCLAAKDEIGFGVGPGHELKIDETIYNDAGRARREIVVDEVAEEADYCDHRAPGMYGVQSYVSMPIFLKDGGFYGTLCAIDSKPAKLGNPTVVGMFRMFADLIGAQLDTAKRVVHGRDSFLDARQTADLREQFLAVLGHDLRNPVAAVAAGIQLLGRAELDERTRSVVELMQKSVDRISVLIEDIMDLARGRMGSGIALERSTRELEPGLRHVIDELRATHPGRTIEAEFDLCRPMSLDPYLIARALSNLLGNALTHGAADAPVFVRASTTNGFELSVTNSGPDIPPASMERLFAPFTRGETTSDKKGLGLGLYIVSEIARAHGGSIEASSKGGRTCFTFRIPVADSSTSAAHRNVVPE